MVTAGSLGPRHALAVRQIVQCTRMHDGGQQGLARREAHLRVWWVAVGVGGPVKTSASRRCVRRAVTPFAYRVRCVTDVASKGHTIAAKNMVCRLAWGLTRLYNAGLGMPTQNRAASGSSAKRGNPLGRWMPKVPQKSRVICQGMPWAARHARRRGPPTTCGWCAARGRPAMSGRHRTRPCPAPPAVFRDCCRSPFGPLWRVSGTMLAGFTQCQVGADVCDAR